MIKLRRAEDRGHADHGWLDTWHTFSFANYHDPAYTGFRSLLVINEDRVEPGAGFPMHSHRDMEIITWILEGALQHKDSLGSAGVIRRNDAQRMSAGTGITHSEYNASDVEPVHLIQIWILPNTRGISPVYEQRTLGEVKNGRWQGVVSGSGRDEALTVHQDVELLVTRLDSLETIGYPLGLGRHAWVQVTRGRVTLNGHQMKAGDGAAMSEEMSVVIDAEEASEVLLFDLA